MKITILPQELCEKIAAGEVIERPVSALKELIENAIDAGACSIIIECTDGGKKLMRITDNGCGMSAEDARLALQRHATSKLHTEEDMDHIQTLGFRGEALPSIAAVSRMTITTRDTDSPAGLEITVEGGKVLYEKELGTAQGTTIEVKNLFYNLPARRKFLKSGQSESMQINKLITTYALCHPEIGFSYTSEGTTKEYPAVSDPAVRIKQCLDLEGGKDLFPVSYKRDDISVTGFASFPHCTTAVRNRQYFFVNSRPVYAATASYSIEDAYRRTISKDRYPVYIINITIPPDTIDVNIHPAKHQIKFQTEKTVRECLFHSIEEGLKNQEYFTPVKTEKKEDAGFKNPPFWQNERVSALTYMTDNADDLVMSPPNGMTVQEEIFATSSVPLVNRLSFLGIFKDSFLICINEEESEVVIIDMHAAHERVLYEQYLSLFNAKKIASQALLLPSLLKLTGPNAGFLEEQIPLLHTMGFEIGQVGPAAYIVEGVPEILEDADIERAFIDILDELQADKRSHSYQEKWDEHVLKKICRSAVKFGKKLSSAEAERLITTLYKTPNYFTCPHGRPTIKTFSYKELRHMFERT